MRVFVPLPRPAVLHALARDAWPHLVTCMTPQVPLRGYVNVELAETPRGVSVRMAGAPVGRYPVLQACLEAAVRRTVLPPHDGPTPSVSVAFDLVFNLPAVRGGRARAH